MLNATATPTLDVLPATHYICVTYNYWGKGTSIAEAKRNCKREVGKAFSKYIIYASTDNGMYVDDMGNVHASKGSNLHEVERHI